MITWLSATLISSNACALSNPYHTHGYLYPYPYPYLGYMYIMGTGPGQSKNTHGLPMSHTIHKNRIEDTTSHAPTLEAEPKVESDKEIPYNPEGDWYTNTKTTAAANPQALNTWYQLAT